ncbi:hypothetical protein GZL_09096 [Streptomyces sp. 769]|nr:hypothetical protein GZL_09096 [Streptomyces sp. 769]
MRPGRGTSQAGAQRPRHVARGRRGAAAGRHRARVGRRGGPGRDRASAVAGEAARTGWVVAHGCLPSAPVARALGPWGPSVREGPEREKCARYCINVQIWKGWLRGFRCGLRDPGKVAPSSCVDMQVECTLVEVYEGHLVR